MAAADVVTLHAALTDAHARPDRRRRAGGDAARLVPRQLLPRRPRRRRRARRRRCSSGHLAGCALDVLPVEPPAAGEPALTWPRTIVNPHAAWASDESIRLPYLFAASSVAAVLRGDEPERDVIARPAP